MERRDGDTRPERDPRVGLCSCCHHGRVKASARGSGFWRCGLSDTDASWARYPRLPVLECGGFRASSGDC